MGLKATPVVGNKLLEFEIERYREVLADTAEVHRYVYKGSDRVFEDVYMPEGVAINRELEDDLIQYQCELRYIEPSTVEYAGPINAEQALGAIMIRKEVMMLENAPAVLGAFYTRPGDKVAV